MGGQKLNPDFFENSQQITETGCMIWMRGVVGKGYGATNVSGRFVQAHRRAWEITYGPIPEGICVLHKCDVPLCVNPKHLFLCTITDNNRDLVAKGRSAMTKRTHCPKGHPYSTENTIIGHGSRHCRECRRLRKRIKEKNLA